MVLQINLINATIWIVLFNLLFTLEHRNFPCLDNLNDLQSTPEKFRMIINDKQRRDLHQTFRPFHLELLVSLLSHFLFLD